MDFYKRMGIVESVEVIWNDKGWKVNLRKYGWKHTIDEVKEFIDLFEKEEA